MQKYKMDGIEVEESTWSRPIKILYTFAAIKREKI